MFSGQAALRLCSAKKCSSIPLLAAIFLFIFLPANPGKHGDDEIRTDPPDGSRRCAMTIAI